MPNSVNIVSVSTCKDSRCSFSASYSFFALSATFSASVFVSFATECPAAPKSPVPTASPANKNGIGIIIPPSFYNISTESSNKNSSNSAAVS